MKPKGNHSCRNEFYANRVGPRVTRRLMQLEIEEAALKKESDDASKKRLKNLQEELADLREEANAMKNAVETERRSQYSFF